MKIEIWVTSIGSIASTLCFVYEICKFKTKKHKVGAVALIIILSCLTMFLGSRYYTSITTETCSGNFKNKAEGRQEFYYPIIYEKPPNLIIRPTSLGLASPGPRLVEQRADGFVVVLNYISDQFEWIAEGVPKSYTNTRPEH